MDARYDVIIIGARCAGAATAMLLARRGARVLLVDRAPAGSDTLSTHALMRGGVLQLARWGLLEAIIEGGAPAVRTTTFHYGDDDAVEVAIKSRDGVDALYAPRRTLLDRVLVAAARRAGAEVRHGVSARALLRGPGGRVVGVALEENGAVREMGAGLVIGADGVRSTVARHAHAPTTHTAACSTAIVYGYWSGAAVSGTHWHYRPGVAAGAIPTDGGLTCVFVAVPPLRYSAELRAKLQPGYRRVLAEAAPALLPALAGARLVGPLRPFPGRAGYLRRARGPGWALVGDAGYFKDPLTAHGITDALRDAETLARAVAAGSELALARYEHERDGASFELFDLTARIASFAWDLDEIRRLHRALSDVMNHEAAALAA